jgi:hypothetical protein
MHSLAFARSPSHHGDFGNDNRDWQMQNCQTGLTNYINRSDLFRKQVLSSSKAFELSHIAIRS